MSSTKWQAGGSGSDTSYNWSEFTIKPVPMSLGPNHWELEHNGVTVMRDADLMVVMDYGERLAERLKIEPA